MRSTPTSARFARDAATLRPGDGPYPGRLVRLADPPPVLRALGTLRDGPAVAIVGSRTPDGYGRDLAREVAAGLARAGVSVVSGGARGIDGEAHLGALEGCGHTVAVLGTGIDVPYPAGHRALFERILEAGGALLTEQPDGMQAFPGNFPRRNRIVAALVDAVLVVQARPGSGALITSGIAGRLGVPLLACPGDVRDDLTFGPLALLRAGAGVVADAGDVLRVLGIAAPAAPAQLPLPALGGEEGALLGALSKKPRHLDEVARATGLSAGAALAGLLALELRGLVEQRPGGHFLTRA